MDTPVCRRQSRPALEIARRDVESLERFCYLFCQITLKFFGGRLGCSDAFSYGELVLSKFHLIVTKFAN